MGKAWNWVKAKAAAFEEWKSANKYKWTALKLGVGVGLFVAGLVFTGGAAPLGIAIAGAVWNGLMTMVDINAALQSGKKADWKMVAFGVVKGTFASLIGFDATELFE